MRYKVLCSDLDGTLLSTKNDVSDFTVSQISRIKHAMRILLVSARMPRSMTYLQRRMGIEHEPLICYNGALIWEDGKELTSTEIPLSDVSEIYRMAEKRGIGLGLYRSNEWYVEDNTTRVRKEIHHTQATPVFRPTPDTLEDWGQRNIGAHKLMLMGTQDTIDSIFLELQEYLGTVVQLYRSNDTLIEISPKTVSKLSAIRAVMAGGHSLEEVIAFGDNYNDIEMLQHVGCGVAVGNAREEVKRIADHITLENTEHGVAQFIEQHINI